MISSYVVEHAQKDGRKWVNETHIENGVTYTKSYLSTDQMDKEALLTAHASQILARLKIEEIDNCILLDRITTVYNTKTETAAEIRQRYKESSGEALVKIARWIRRRILAGDFTETQVRNAFGLTVGQWDVLKTKMQTYDDALSVVETAVGE